MYPLRLQLQSTIPALANGHFGMQMLLPCFLSMASNFGGLSLKSQVVLFAGHLLICMMAWESESAASAARKLEMLWMVTSAVICNGIILMMFVMRRHDCRSEYDSCPNLILLFFLFMVLVMSGFYSSSNKATSEDIAKLLVCNLLGLAMLPQYIFTYRESADLKESFVFTDPESDATPRILAKAFVTVYKLLNCAFLTSWLFSLLIDFDDDPMKNPYASLVPLWLAVSMLSNLCLFADFLLFLVTGYSLLRTAVLRVDTKAGEVSKDMQQRLGQCLLKPEEHKVLEAESCTQNFRKEFALFKISTAAVAAAVVFCCTVLSVLLQPPPR